jgi:hypothetical protein
VESSRGESAVHFGERVQNKTRNKSKGVGKKARGVGIYQRQMLEKSLSDSRKERCWLC